MDANAHGIPSNRYNPHAWIIGNPMIGEGTWIGAFTLVDGRGGLSIGLGCDISSGAHLLTHSSAWRCVTERGYNRVDQWPTVIEDFVFVGENATVLMGVRIGHHSIVAAGSVVLEGTIIPPYSLVAGVPARIVRSIKQDIDSFKASGADGPGAPREARLLREDEEEPAEAEASSPGPDPEPAPRAPVHAPGPIARGKRVSRGAASHRHTPVPRVPSSS